MCVCVLVQTAIDEFPCHGPVSNIRPAEERMSILRLEHSLYIALNMTNRITETNERKQQFDPFYVGLSMSSLRLIHQNIKLLIAKPSDRTIIRCVFETFNFEWYA